MHVAMQTESESERAGPSSSRTRKKSVPAISDPARATYISPIPQVYSALL